MKMVEIDDVYNSSTDYETIRIFHYIHWESENELCGIIEDKNGKKTDFSIKVTD